jgi:hypothetical protein
MILTAHDVLTKYSKPKRQFNKSAKAADIANPFSVTWWKMKRLDCCGQDDWVVRVGYYPLLRQFVVKSHAKFRHARPHHASTIFPAAAIEAARSRLPAEDLALCAALSLRAVKEKPERPTGYGPTSNYNIYSTYPHRSGKTAAIKVARSFNLGIVL